jgi:hypothetical protein
MGMYRCYVGFGFRCCGGRRRRFGRGGYIAQGIVDFPLDSLSRATEFRKSFADGAGKLRKPLAAKQQKHYEQN